ncbi:transmembrane amino acid transporter protein-domain-containing protein [Lipomyces kononenkoae]|uniref:Transmembrane amino acid transporter protein-domain-containing protein n=1 Tax=Lipomyces kononenkoae TaxID=34357 RepID=A0ACC3SV00_LIPKO
MASHSQQQQQQQSPVIAVIAQQRRGSLTRSLRFAGGVNSLDRFASSYTRAQAFLVNDAAAAQSPAPAGATVLNGSIPLADDDDDEESAIAADDYDDDAEDVVAPSQIVNDDVYHATATDARYSSSDDDATHALLLPDDGDATSARNYNTSRGRHKLAPVAVSVSGGHASARVRGGVSRAAARVRVPPGRSTAPQTIFNSVNVLIGIGLLSLPLAFSYAGWLLGILFVIAAAATTLYTAKVLARCLDTDPTLVTYADIAYAAFGARARLLTSFLFSVELLGSCVALVVLFADSLATLLPADADGGSGLSKTALKIIAFMLLTPLSFVPLSVLSVTSILGIVSTFGLVLIVLVDGLVKTTSPGSLWHVMPSSILPANWNAVPLSLGLLMAPWCGHSVFPNVYRDMRHPYKFQRCLTVSYSFAFLVDVCMAILGLLMFGSEFVTEEITNTILNTPGYPRALNSAIIVLIAFIPLSKTPLNARPIITTIEVLLGVAKTQHHRVTGEDDIEFDNFHDDDEDDDNTTTNNMQSRPWLLSPAAWLSFMRSPAVARATIRILTNVVVVIIAIVFPAFDRIMALVGSALGFTICIVLPLAFYLKIFGPGRTKAAYYISPSGQSHLGTTHELTKTEIAFAIFAIVVGAILAVVGGVWALLPDEFIFGKDAS